MLRFFRLSRTEVRFACTSFVIQLALFWFAELVICELDSNRSICHLIGRGFLPCLISFAVMDIVVVPHLRRRLAHRNDQP